MAKAKLKRTLAKKSRNASVHPLRGRYPINSRFLAVIYAMLSPDQRRELESFALYLKSRGRRRSGRGAHDQAHR